MIVGCVALVMSLAGALGIVRATNSHLDSVRRVPAATPALSPPSEGVENFLLVGSDSRASADPSDKDFATMGTEEANPGMRTVQRALNVPIHHYIEINFSGFKQIVDAIGGVHVCVPRASRDKATGFHIGRKACKLQSGVEALSYARARHFEEKIDGVWRLEGTGDVGRGTRQRAFMSMLAKDAAKYLAQHPLDAHNVLKSFGAAVSVDERLDLIDLARKLRPIGDGTAVSYALPVSDGWAGSNFVFRLANEAPPLLAYFAGLGPAPAAS